MMLEVGARAPDFALPDQTGTMHHLADALATGPVVLAFLKADCTTCTRTFPYLERLHQAYRRADWRLWGISQHPARAAEWFARNTGVTFPLLIDGEGFPVSHAYDPPATPTIFLLGRTGTVLGSHTGMSKSELNGLAGHLAAALGEDAVVIAPPDDGQPDFRPG
jgi:peroxiredoxin